MDLQINSTKTNIGQLELKTSSQSAWHCQQKCQDDYDCVWFSWKYSGADGRLKAGHLISQKKMCFFLVGDCWLMGVLPQNYDLSTAIGFQPGWLSSGKDCQVFLEQFSSKY